MTRYADVILPLPLYSTFTYRVPEIMQEQLKVGSRVLVPFAKTGCHTGIVTGLHSDTPAQGVDIKPIMALLDDEPILRHPQLKFWQWMARYYLCSPGEVMKAALPAALKVESESWLSPADDPDPEEIQLLSQQQALVYAFIVHHRKVRIADIEKEVQVSSPRIAINKLIEKGLVQSAERVVDKYITRKIAVVSLCCTREDKEALHACFNAVKRSRSQEKLLVTFLDLSGWLQAGKPLRQVGRKALQEKAGVTPSVFNALVKKGIFKVSDRRVNRFSEVASTGMRAIPVLTEPQQTALRAIRHEMGSHLVTLLRGVTGSGKTEIYSHLIHDALSHGDYVLMLVPEISLTTQLTTRLRAIFGDRMLVYHSKFSDSERVDIWRRLLTSASPMLILGVRSSVFLPFPRVGLIIVDEEHESSYKQFDPAPRYNARDAAIMLASMHGAKVLLGSATPAIDTYYKASTGKYGLVELLTRFSDMPLPSVDVIDIRDRRKKHEVSGPFSKDLLSAVRHAVSADKQAIVFQNRRGFAPMVICSTCGWTPRCPHCDISLVYHRSEHLLKCHYCGYTMPVPQLCPACGTNSLRSSGYGTERLSDSLANLLPEVPIARMDLDTTRAKDAYQDIIENFSKGKTRILVGTQMVTKGLDFKDVTVVGIVNADTLINFPDFRSNERAFSTFEQVAGRAGRHSDTGRVLIQTTNPLHPSITYVKTHDYKGFYSQELQQRRRFIYPPFVKIINIYLRHKDASTLDSLTETYTRVMRQTFGQRVLGPDTPDISRIAGWHIRVIMLKIEPEASMTKVKQVLHQIYAAVANLPGMKSLRLHYDVDPA